MNPAAADPPAPPDPRRHDLDALRAAAMLLGIVYHAALAYAAGFGWMIEDPSRSTGLYLFQAAVHGFRMPLFFVVSGFFTALLWRKRGLSAVWKNRLLRIFLPCLLGLVTLVPAMGWASGSAMAAGFRLRKAAETARTATADATVWSALASGDAAALDRVLARKPPLDVQQPESGVVPLTLVALQGREDLARRLLDAG
ncbi:MAG: acyltransferase family protein, partial [Verrucomicrobiota bacterium]